MIGRRELTELVVDDALVRFDRATLWMASDRNWHLEVDNAEPGCVGRTGERKRVAMRMADGAELRGEVRAGPRRLYPFNRSVVFEGVEPLAAPVELVV
jgi:hypothetical protein